MIRQQKIQEYCKLQALNNINHINFNFQIKQQENAFQKYYQIDILEIVYDRREIYSNKIRKMQRNLIFQEKRNLFQAQQKENQLFLYKEDECFKITNQFIGLMSPLNKYEVVQGNQESDIQLAVEICKLNLYEGIELNFPNIINTDSVHQISRLQQQYSQLIQLYQQFSIESQSLSQSIQTSPQQSLQSSSQRSHTSHQSSQSSSQDFQIERIRQLIIRVINDLESITSSQTYDFSEFSEFSIFEDQPEQDDDQRTETDDY
ncbi:unnamed protein product (macronuclear) [Paramecium tetraurelia]|uniref:Uncharacterized protein n=1 Tax=Paramecium tetraurelia TaxID=5888 RepID=A0DW92_PARTE|nr:uncharacterized protein GSPATT00020950001 [Paramecium tetraurelia]CAK87309.1 unnamed protein product [Paramecium tetraurelia]|eukprot:XP_001454706.1 hypothetical protein (macronuclear) [Paramecium tetraurelia strain d4-2]